MGRGEIKRASSPAHSLFFNLPVFSLFFFVFLPFLYWRSPALRKREASVHFKTEGIKHYIFDEGLNISSRGSPNHSWNGTESILIFYVIRKNWVSWICRTKNYGNKPLLMFSFCQARIYDELGYTIERNACAAECWEILQRPPVHYTRSSLFVLWPAELHRNVKSGTRTSAILNWPSGEYKPSVARLRKQITLREDTNSCLRHRYCALNEREKLATRNDRDA